MTPSAPILVADDNAAISAANNGSAAEQPARARPPISTDVWLYVFGAMLLFRVAIGNCFVASALFLNNSVPAECRLGADVFYV